jgi:hypothetical protein
MANNIKAFNHLIVEVIGNGKEADITCNGNIFKAEKRNGDIILFNPLGTVIGNGAWDVQRFFGNTVIDSIEYFKN